VDEIVKLPINLLHSDDERTWNSSQNVIYSVRLAYYLLAQVIIETDHLKVEGNWKKLWKLIVPHKVKLFLWRDLRGACLYEVDLFKEGSSVTTSAHTVNKRKRMNGFVSLTATLQVVWKET
jgi:hypothetical protein